MLKTMNGTRFLRVSELRKQKNISVMGLAELAGIAYNTALNYERDSTNLLDKAVLRKIAHALDVPVRELIAEDETN